MRELLEFLARSLVDDPAAVVVEQFDDDDGTVVLELVVGEDDYGKVVTLPCWQMPGGVYGDEQCEGITSIGLFKVMVPEKEGASVICDKILFPVHRQQRWVAR